eukprot:COSAG06_NODE_7911_length_2332_cov_110.119857_1_plen_213_part_00
MSERGKCCRTQRTSCASLPCLALPCLALPCLALPCLALPCLALPCLALPCLALPCLALPCLALPCLALPCLALPCLALPRHSFTLLSQSVGYYSSFLTLPRALKVSLPVVLRRVSSQQKAKKLRVELVAQIDKNAEFMVSGIITAGDRRLGARSGTGKKVVELAKMCVASSLPDPFFSQLSLCLSRACLGKMIVLHTYNRTHTTVSLHRCTP